MLESSTKHPSRPPPTLHSLPTEIISQIVLWLDRNSAIVLARTARRFTPLAERRIWQQLDLRLHPNFGEHPLIVPHAFNVPAERELYDDWKDDEGWRAEARHKAGLKEKMKTILFRADERRAGMVKEVSVVPREGSVMAQIQILDLVSPGLRTLAIESPSYFSQQRVSHFYTHDTLDYYLMTTKPSFPSLTHLRLGHLSIHFIGLVSLLCSCAPNLTSLEVGRDLEIVEDEDPPTLSFPMLEQETKLQQLRIIRDNGDDLGQLDEERGNPYILDIIKQSPLLRNLAIETSSFSEAQRILLLKHIGELRGLQSLYVAEDLSVTQSFSYGKTLSSSMTSLVVDSSRWWHMFRYLPSSPSLQVIYLDTPEGDMSMPPTAYSSEPATVRPMIPSFVAGLRRCSGLQAIHTATCSEIVQKGARIDLFARVDLAGQRGEFTGAIRSLSCGGAELLHARTLERYIELSDEPLGSDRDMGSMMYTRYSYTDWGGRQRVKRFKALPDGESVWTDYTDFKGLKVPLEIIQQMRQVEGASEKDWMGRGIEVGEAAWKVLTDWRDRMREEGQREERM